MTEIVERRAQTEQQNRQGLLKDLFKIVHKKALPLSEKNVPTYQGELINGIFATGMTIEKSHILLEQKSTIPLIEIHPLNDRYTAETLFINIKNLGITLIIWKKREKEFIPKHSYGLTIQSAGEKYQRFLNENHGDDVDFSSTKKIRELTKNIQGWKRV